MGYQLDAARATIDERLRQAEQFRLARAARRKNRRTRSTPQAPARPNA
ncbi:hypothetical protein [Kitasatospora sp. NPDC085879]